MKSFPTSLRWLLFLATLLGIFGWPFTTVAQAQMTVFNVPSADTPAKGQVFLQHEVQMRNWRTMGQPRFAAHTLYGAYGLTPHLELDATVFNLGTPHNDVVTGAIGLKQSIPVLPNTLPQQELKLTLGQMVPVGLEKSQVGSWSYAHVSGRLPKTKTRLTAGVSAGTEGLFGRDTVAMVAALEQPLTKRVSLQADWYSGTHALGLLIPGVAIALPKRFTLYAGYQLPNNRRCGSQGFVFELAKFLN